MLSTPRLSTEVSAALSPAVATRQQAAPNSQASDSQSFAALLEAVTAAPASLAAAANPPNPPPSVAGSAAGDASSHPSPAPPGASAPTSADTTPPATEGDQGASAAVAVAESNTTTPAVGPKADGLVPRAPQGLIADAGAAATAWTSTTTTAAATCELNPTTPAGSDAAASPFDPTQPTNTATAAGARSALVGPARSGKVGLAADINGDAPPATRAGDPIAMLLPAAPDAASTASAASSSTDKGARKTDDKTKDDDAAAADDPTAAPAAAVTTLPPPAAAPIAVDAPITTAPAPAAPTNASTSTLVIGEGKPRVVLTATMTAGDKETAQQTAPPRQTAPSGDAAAIADDVPTLTTQPLSAETRAHFAAVDRHTVDKRTAGDSSAPAAAMPSADATAAPASEVTAPVPSPSTVTADHATARAADTAVTSDTDVSASGAGTRGGGNARSMVDNLAGIGFLAATAAHPEAMTGGAPSAAMAAAQTVPIAGLAVAIAARAQPGANRFEIRLDPPELGRIDVRLNVDRDGRLTSHVTVERPETLHLLQNQQPQLERALEQAGLKTADNGLQFTLRDQSFTGQNNSGGSHSSPAQLVIPDADLPPVEAVQTYTRSRFGSGVDIRV